MRAESKFLLDLLVEKKRANPRFSLRAFAKQLEISPAQLSQIISGKRALTLSVAKRVSERLSLSPSERMALLRLTGRELITGRLEAEASGEGDEYLHLREDQFKIIAEWYHLAILSLGEIKGNRAEPKWIARRLGIDEVTALAAFNRLKRLGLVECLRGGGFRQSSKPIQTTTDISSSAIRKYHKQNLELAMRRLEEISVELREFSAITMAIHPKALPKAKRMIAAFKKELCQELEKSGAKEVYTLAVQLFPASVPGAEAQS